MQNKTNRVIRVAAVAAALAFTAFQASAQEGTFNLPVEAHWGHAVLEPGVHEVAIPTAALGQKIVYLTTGKRQQLTVPLTSQAAHGDRSYLHLVKVNGTYYVDAYQSQIDGRKYFFSKPKAPKGEEAAAMGEQETLVEVDTK